MREWGTGPFFYITLGCLIKTPRLRLQNPPYLGGVLFNLNIFPPSAAGGLRPRPPAYPQIKFLKCSLMIFQHYLKKDAHFTTDTCHFSKTLDTYCK